MYLILKIKAIKYIRYLSRHIYKRVYMERYDRHKSRSMLKYLFNHSTAPESKKKSYVIGTYYVILKIKKEKKKKLKNSLIFLPFSFAQNNIENGLKRFQFL